MEVNRTEVRHLLFLLVAAVLFAVVFWRAGFTAKGIIYCARQNDFYYGFLEGSDIIVQDNDVYVIGDTYNEVAVYANSIKNWAIESERQESWRYVQVRRLWAEYQAKMEVNYNAAWRYHCTYGNGSETPPFYEIHPAYR